MFGVLRTTLALMVMAYHLFLRIPPLGIYPVFGFYIVSGYLMTLIMHESYGYSFYGRLSFAENRALRLFPLYWAAALLTVALIFLKGADVMTGYHISMGLPETLKSVAANFLMVFPSVNPFSVTPRLVPPSWALTVEMFFYLLICLGLSKSAWRVLLWLALSLVYVAYTFYLDTSWRDRYFPIMAASLPFAIGSGIYFLQKSNRLYSLFLKLRISSVSWFSLLLVNCGVWTWLDMEGHDQYVDVGFYLNVLFAAVLVYSLAKGGSIFSSSRSFDKFIGNYSYPIYLLHLQVGFIVSLVFFGEPFHEYSTRGFVSFLIAIPVIFALSFILLQFIDKPVQRLRSRIKSSAELKQAL